VPTSRDCPAPLAQLAHITPATRMRRPLSPPGGPFCQKMSMAALPEGRIGRCSYHHISEPASRPKAIPAPLRVTRARPRRIISRSVPSNCRHPRVGGQGNWRYVMTQQIQLHGNRALRSEPAESRAATLIPAQSPSARSSAVGLARLKPMTLRFAQLADTLLKPGAYPELITASLPGQVSK